MIWPFHRRASEPAPEPEKLFDIYFAPEDDITALELANIISHVKIGITTMERGIKCSQGVWDSMPANLKRHWWRS